MKFECRYDFMSTCSCLIMSLPALYQLTAFLQHALLCALPHLGRAWQVCFLSLAATVSAFLNNSLVSIRKYVNTRGVGFSLLKFSVCWCSFINLPLCKQIWSSTAEFLQNGSRCWVTTWSPWWYEWVPFNVQNNLFETQINLAWDMKISLIL